MPHFDYREKTALTMDGDREPAGLFTVLPECLRDYLQIKTALQELPLLQENTLLHFRWVRNY
ncbi:hypothetical protein SDC9_168089 [bioreactor metagenome]|uniref:Uncharacterized protein n=1 Tax=bioreactor metagenome TaxID=1076179 RepID=A0A645G466_9ZZZZ